MELHAAEGNGPVAELEIAKREAMATSDLSRSILTVRLWVGMIEI
jgi:hypothetical protein